MAVVGNEIWWKEPRREPSQDRDPRKQFETSLPPPSVPISNPKIPHAHQWSLSALPSEAEQPKPKRRRKTQTNPFPPPLPPLQSRRPSGRSRRGPCHRRRARRRGGLGVSEFSLPDDVLAVLPRDPYEQLDLARRITALAVAGRVTGLEREAARLREGAAKKDRENAELRERVALLDRALQETNARLRGALEDNIKLSKERDSLAQTYKKQARDLQKLESFKRHLMQSLRDDSSSPQETIDITTCDLSVSSKTSSCGDGTISHSTTNLLNGSVDVGSTTREAARPPVQKYALSPHINQRLTPEATPNLMSTTASPRGMSTTATPKLMSGATSPSRTRMEGHMSMTPWYSSKQSTAANSPPRGRPNPGRTPRIDGKEFFRQARSRLSYEQFGAFLANIKELNAHKQSREETLKKAEEIFGPESKDLYLSFQGLLNRSLP